MFNKLYKKLGLVLLLITVMALSATAFFALTASADEEPTYTITVNVNDTVEGAEVYLTVGGAEPIEVESGSSYTLVRGTQYVLSSNVDAITGYRTAWTNSAGAPTNLSGQIGRDLVYNVSFLPDTYTIHYVGREQYDFANGIASTHTYDSETVIVNPIRDGYDLIGWICYDHEPTEGDTTGRALAASPTLGKQDYTSDIWLEPIWQGKLYCVIRLDCVFQAGQVYNLGECLGYEILTEYRMGETVPGSAGPATSYRGYSYYEDYGYAADAITVTISYEASEVEALRAKIGQVIEDPDAAGYNVVFRYYLPKEYTVTTDLNAGNAAVSFEEGKTMPQKHVFNQNTALPIPSRVGYTFNGWLLSVEGAEGEELLAPGVSIEAKKYDGNITLKASWTPKQYAVTYDWNGKDEANDQAIALLNKTLLEKFATYTYDTPVAFPAPLRSGYSFRGWVISVEGEVLYEGKLFTELPAEMFSMEDPKAVTLTAQWQANTYTVTFNGNGATDGVYPESTTVVFDQPLVLEGLTVPVRFGYVFQGYWSCDSQGFFLKAYVSPQGESLCEIWDIPSDTTLIAKWEKLPEIVPPTFKINYIKETIEVEGGIPEGHYVFTLGDKVLDVTVDAEGKITVNRTVVNEVRIPDAFLGQTIAVLVWGDGVTTSNYEGRITLASRPAAPTLNQEIADIRPDYTTIEIVMADLLPYGYEFAISRDPNADIASLTWQSAPRFENLLQGTVYYVYVRVNEAEDHPHGLAGVWKYETYYVNYLEERIERMQDLRLEGDGGQVDAVIKAAIQQAREMTPSPTFYEDLEKLYQDTVSAVAFARLQDQHIAELRELCRSLIATGLYTDANEALLASLGENAVAAIIATDKSDEVRSIAEAAREAIYAVKISHLFSEGMEMTSRSGLARSIRLSMVFLSDFSALSESVNTSIRDGHILYSGTSMAYGDLCDALLTKYVAAAYRMGLYDGDTAYTAFDGLYEFRLLLSDELKDVQGLMVGYYNERTGQLEILEARREGNCLVFTSDRVTDFVILGDPVVELTSVIAALALILLCQLVAVVLLIVRRVKTAKKGGAHKAYSSLLPIVALTVRLLPANALVTVVALGAMVILLQIVLICLLLSSDLVRRAKPRREETDAQALPTEEPEQADATDEAAAALTYAYTAELAEDAEDELSEEEYETDPNNYAEASEADPFDVYDDEVEEIADEELLEDPTYGVDLEGEVFADPAYINEEGEDALAHPAYIAEGEEQTIAEGEYPAETAYVDEETGEVFAEGEIEDFIEPAANPRYSLPDEEDLSNSELPAEEVYAEDLSSTELPTEEVYAELSGTELPAEEAYAEIPEEEIPFAVETAEELPAEETAVWEDFAENGAEEVWNDPADPEKK